MSLTTVHDVLFEMGKAGKRLDEIHSVEAGAGNISVAVKNLPVLSEVFSQQEENFALPAVVPELAGCTVFVTGSGRRNRELYQNPEESISAFVVNEGGQTATWYYSPNKLFERPTSEFNSHLAVHAEQVSRRQLDFHSVVHAQPPYLVQLSHDSEYANDLKFNESILRWEPESIVQLPQGVKFLPFMVPGSETLMQNNVEGLKDHQITIWAKHGLMARADDSPVSAVDKIEYAETGAMYEICNLMNGSRGSGLLREELQAVIEAFGVDTPYFK